MSAEKWKRLEEKILNPRMILALLWVLFGFFVSGVFAVAYFVFIAIGPCSWDKEVISLIEIPLTIGVFVAGLSALGE